MSVIQILPVVSYSSYSNQDFSSFFLRNMNVLILKVTVMKKKFDSSQILKKKSCFLSV